MTASFRGFISENVKITKVADAAEAATTDVTCAEVDMAGFDGVLFLTSLGTAAANNTMKAQQDTATGMASAADIEGSAVDLGGASDEDLWLDVYRPRERFVRAVVVRGTSSTCENVWAIQYNAKDGLPISNLTAGTIYGKRVGPFAAEGTA